MKKEITLIGCFRSGTNFTRTVLESNFDCIVYYNTWGWKHGLMPTYNRSSKIQYSDTNIITVVKNPFSILDSWFRYINERDKNMKGNKESFQAFLRSPIYFYDEVEDNIAPEYYFSNPISMWNSVVWNHISFIKQMNGVVIKYEDMLNNPVDTVKIISSKFGLERNSTEFKVPKKRVRNMGDAKKAKRNYYTSKAFNKSDYFLNNKFLEGFSSDDIEFVLNEINERLVYKTAYDEIMSY